MKDQGGETVIAASIASWPSRLEQAVFGTDDPRGIFDVLDDFCVAALGTRVREVVFYRRGVGAVFGIELADGRRIVVKVHPAEIVGDRLDGVRRVQRHLADLGLPAPRPLGRPAAVGNGVAAAEQMLERGRLVDGHDPAVRRVIARGLRGFVEAATPMLERVRLPAAHPFDLAGNRLWPAPHELRFDFTLKSGTWIDEIAAEGRGRLRGPIEHPVIGHTDWRVENLRFEVKIVAIFDWDSVAVCSEAALVGATSVTFTTNWDEQGIDPFPSPAESSAFIAEYEASRGRAFTARERELIDAAALYQLAYGARCEHSDVELGLFPEIDPHRGWRELLRARRAAT